jgi:hypothetical protein
VHQLHSLIYHPRPRPSHQDLHILCISWGLGGTCGNQVLEWLRGTIGVHPTGPPPSDNAIVEISCHHPPPMSFLQAPCVPSSHQCHLGGCPLVGNPLPQLSPFRITTRGSHHFYFVFILYNHDFIGLFKKCENKYLRKSIFKKSQALQNAMHGLSC